MIKESTAPHAALLLRVSLGIYASIVAIPLALEMIGTVVLVHGANGWLFTNKGGGGWEFPAFWAVGLVVLYLLGDGAMALKPTPPKGT